MSESATDIGSGPVFYKGMSQRRESPGGDGRESLGITGPTKRERQKITPLGPFGAARPTPSATTIYCRG